MNTTQEIEIFSTGMTTDLRKVIRVNRKILRPFQSLQHFDVYADRLVPKRDWVLDSGATSNQLTRFMYFDDISGYTLWGLGLNGSNHCSLLKKDNTNPFAGVWNTPANGITTAISSGNAFLFGYKGYLYFPSTNGLNRYQVATTTMTEGWQAGTFTVAPVIHPRTGAAYFFAGNSVHEVDPTGTWVGLVQQLPANMVITSAVPLGNNLAIGAAPLNGNDNSTTYLWDLSVTSSPTSINFTESIDFGKGQLAHLTNILGTLVGVSQEQLDQPQSINKGRMVARVYSGTVAQEANYLKADALVSVPIAATNYQDGEKLFFPASMPFNGDSRIGIWSVDGSGNFAIDAIGPTAEAGHRVVGLYRFGKAWFVAFDDNNVYRTNDQVSFITPAILETTIYGDRFNSCQFAGATVSFEKLTSGQSVTLKYKLPEDTAWTLMGTQSTAGKRELEVLATAIKQSPTLNEYQFRVESIGAIITGLSWETENFDTNTYGG
jgi:hypothetical protein